MSIYDSSYGSSSPLESTKSMRLMLEKRSCELFNLCDLESKGFINKKDIQRVSNLEPGFTPEMLEEVFESLDSDGNGFLTLDEFTYGFASLFQPETIDIDGTSNYSVDNSHCSISEQDEVEIETDFKETMDNLGANELIQNSSTDIKELWARLRNDDPGMLKNFENFIGQISQEMHQTKNDFNMLESALQSKSSSYDEHIRKLYEEMENQIKTEKARIHREETLKENELREKMEMTLKEKEHILQDSISKQIDLERHLNKLNSAEYQQKVENERLVRQNSILEEQLMEQTKSLEESKTYISTLQTQGKEEKKNRAKQAWRNSENVVVERSNLIKELEKLRNINKSLQDERDELELQTRRKSSVSLNPPPSSRALAKRDSVLSNYFPNYKLTENENSTFIEEDDDVYEDESPYISNKKSKNIQPNNSVLNTLENTERISQIEKRIAVRHQDASFAESFETEIPIQEESLAQTINFNYTEIMNVPANATPERVFKIVFIGDSGVGKTSFVQRFCNDNFKASFNTTIGVDFQVKLMSIEGKIIALQLWDTAGQERYRSITKQYFRKADGVICMYDVTSEYSFKNLRNWIQSMRECASEDCLLCIIGNKIDMCETEEQRVVRHKDGQRLSEETKDCMFFETSSKKSVNIVESMEAIARVLKEKEDKQIEDVLNLNMKEKKKKGCCDF